jgi:RNA polymerase-binding transcription factor
MTWPDRAVARDRLDAEHARVTDRIGALQREYDAIVAAAESANLDDEHDPEGATVGFERAQVQALLQRAHENLADLTAARERLDSGQYGICAACGRPIDEARLAARPTTRTCVACASSSNTR